ncbi:MAG: hypothetical protein ACTSVG_12675 [Alphaproteobacteria bacterium]
MLKFSMALMSMPFPWNAWVGLLMAANLVAPLFFLPRAEAIVAIVALNVGALIMAAIHARLGFVRLLGIGHIFWVPMVIWFAVRAGQPDVDGSFAAWMVAVVVLNSLSLVLDGWDVFCYWRGERAPTL